MNKQTEKSRYPSKYSAGNFITAAQYITELICEKLAQKQKKTLIQQFWKNPEWARFYKQQILAANGLLKLYSELAIITAIKSRRAWSVYSLRAPHLDGMIKEQENLLKSQKLNENPIEIVENKDTLTHRTTEKTKSVLDKLREL